MKIAISGKGGVGKTLLSAFLAKTFAKAGYRVLAIDADPATNLATALNFPNADRIVPIAEMGSLIAERTGAQPGETGSYFCMNPKVDDLPEKYSQEHDGIHLMVMGRAKSGGSGCYCPENALLKSLVAHLLLQRREVVILDMEAGVEHLGRGTAQAVDQLLIVVEPWRQSLETARKIQSLAQDIGIKNIGVVGNKTHNETEREFLVTSLPGLPFLGFIPYDPAIIRADLGGLPLLEASPQIAREVQRIFEVLVSKQPAPAK